MAFSGSKTRLAAVPALALLLFSYGASAGTTAQSTSVEIDNDSSTAAALTQKVNLSGTANPTFPSSIAVGKSYAGVTTTSASSDAGTVWYGDCEFHYSTIMNTDPSTGTVSWTFSQSVLSGGTTNCKAISTSANYETGAHAVQFIIDK